MNKMLKSKGFLILLVLLCAGNLAWSLLSLNHSVRKIPTALQQQFGAASQELKKSPPGIQRGEVFLQRLKAIPVSGAPMEQQEALKEYISAQEQGLDALKNGGDTKAADQKLAAAATSLSKSFNQ
jgi:hypothetical protein